MAEREVLALNETTPQILAPQTGDTYLMPRAVRVTGTATANSFIPTSGTVPTNGMFLGAANSVSFATNSTERWMINASGNLNPVGSFGIGTTLAPVSEVVGNKVSIGVAGTTKGVLTFSGDTSGTVTVQSASAAGTYSLTLPTTAGSASQFLQTNGSGVLTWASAVTAPAGSDTQVQFNDGGAFGGNAGLTFNKTTGLLSATQAAVALGTITTDKKILDLSATWNAAGVTFTGFKLNVTDTASASGSLLLDVQKGGTSGFVLTKEFNMALNSPYASYTADVNGSAAVNGNAILRQLYNAGGNNVVTYSQQFENAAWSKNNVSVSADSISSPARTQTADKLIVSASYSVNGNSVGFDTGATRPLSLHTFSFYAKAGELNLVSLRLYNNPASRAILIDLNSGSILDTKSSGGSKTATYSVTAVGNDWYRIACTLELVDSRLYSYIQTADSTAGDYSFASNGVLSGTGNGTKGIYIWGAQLELGSVASPYTATTTAAVTTANRIFQGVGTAAAPSLTYNQDSATGQFQPAVSSLGWATAGTERMRLDSSGNLGLGVTPSAWVSYATAIDIKTFAAISTSAANSSVAMVRNAYFDGTNWIYKLASSSTAQRFEINNDNKFYWYTAPTGTAGNTATFTERASLSDTAFVINDVGADYDTRIEGDTDANLFFVDASTDRVGIGTNAPIDKLHVSGGGIRVIRDGSDSVVQTSLYVANAGIGENFAFQLSGSGTKLSIINYSDAGVKSWRSRFTFDSVGNFGILPEGNSDISPFAFGASAKGVLGIKNGTAPTTGPADTVQIYSSDLSAGNTMLSVYTEGTSVSDSTDNAVTKKIAVRINGTVYYLLADTDNS